MDKEAENSKSQHGWKTPGKQCPDYFGGPSDVFTDEGATIQEPA